MDDPHPQPPLPFEPALELVAPRDDGEPAREVSFDAFTTILFEEFLRRSARLHETETHS